MPTQPVPSCRQWHLGGSPVELRLLGAPSWRRHPATDRWLPLPHPMALMLAMLAIDGPQPREDMPLRLWAGGRRDEEGRAHVNNRWRQALFRLRRKAGHPLIETDGRCVSLCPDVVVDTADLAADGQPPGAPLLAQLEEAGRDYEGLAWLRRTRQRRHDAWSERRSDAAVRAEATGDMAAAVDALSPLLDRDPGDESRCLRLMIYLGLLGRLPEALRRFDRLQENLARLGRQPAAALVEQRAVVMGLTTPIARPPFVGRSTDLPPGASRRHSLGDQPLQRPPMAT